MSIQMRLHGVKELERALGPTTINPPINRFLLRTGITFQTEMRKRVRVDVGRGRNSLTYQVTKRRVRAGTNLEYLEVMARGRRPGRKWPPPGALLGWMRRHGIDPGPMRAGGIYRANEFLLARKIGRKGIEGDNFDKEAIAASIPLIDGHIQTLAREIERAMQQAVA